MTQTWKARPLGPLAIEHSTVTVAATAAALGTGDVAACIVQAAATNSGTVYLGGEGVTSSDYGIALTAGSSVPIDYVDLSTLYAVGAGGEVLHLLIGRVS